jgi:Spy/CpxP family protein refolding chaperone
MARTSRTAIAAVTGTVALGVGLGIAGLASAAPTTTPSPTASPSASSSAAAPGTAPDGHRGHGGPGRFGDRDGLAQELATKLGVDVAKVRTALQEYRDANRPTTPPDPATKPARDDAALAKALASKLGVDEAKVTSALAEIRSARDAAREKAVTDRLAEAVQAGTLTQAEADAVKKAADAGIVHVGPR